MKTIMIVEDDKNLSDLLDWHFRDAGFECRRFMTAEEALRKVGEKPVDMVVLDRMLPGMSGTDFCRKLRDSGNFTPVLMLTAKAETEDKIEGLEAGADDYLTKPFEIAELMARVKAILRRMEVKVKMAEEQSENPVLLRGEMKLDGENRAVFIHSKRIELTPKEFDLLYVLAKSPGKSYSREQLLNTVWGYNFEGFEHTVNSHINRLRGKVEQDIHRPRFVLTTWGLGYRFNEELT